MKLRTAHFCRRCDEEIIFGEVFILECPHCGFTGGAFDSSIYYEWKVEVPPPFKKIIFRKKFEIQSVGGFTEGTSCPIDTLDRINKGLEKPEEIDEKIKTVSKKGRKVSNR